MPLSMSRRSTLTQAAKLLILAGATTVPAAAKVDPKAAGYQDQPEYGHRCGICVHFAPPNACQIVAGTISPNGWCKLFAPKGG